MADPTLLFAAYGLLFILGLGLVLRPGAILSSLLFNRGFLVMVGLLAIGALTIIEAGPMENLPALAGGGGASLLGAFAGFKLRRLIRGGL